MNKVHSSKRQFMKIQNGKRFQDLINHALIEYDAVYNRIKDKLFQYEQFVSRKFLEIDNEMLKKFHFFIENIIELLNTMVDNHKVLLALSNKKWLDICDVIEMNCIINNTCSADKDSECYFEHLDGLMALNKDIDNVTFVCSDD
jgi:hypothetical protein